MTDYYSIEKLRTEFLVQTFKGILLSTRILVKWESQFLVFKIPIDLCVWIFNIKKLLLTMLYNLSTLFFTGIWYK